MLVTPEHPDGTLGEGPAARKICAQIEDSTETARLPLSCGLRTFSASFAFQEGE